MFFDSTLKYACLRPRLVKNRYTGEEFTANCGTCKACLTRLANKAAYQCSLQAQDYTYCMFVTLTYSNDNIPLLKAIPSDYDFEVLTGNSAIDERCQSFDLYDVTERFTKKNNDFGRFQARCFVTPFYLRQLQRKFDYFGDKIPYLSRYDAQNFMKRFRKHLSKITNEKISYYLVGEYGPVHFRPHFHVLFYFNSKETLQAFGQVLHKSWALGRVDYSLSRGKCSNYVAKYVNCRNSVPKVFADRSLRPFALHSTSFALGIFKSKKKEIYENAPTCFDDSCSKIFGSDVSVYPWRSLVSLFFPKCKRFNDSNYSELSYTYKLYLTASRFYHFETIADLCQSILCDLANMDISSDDVYIKSFSSGKLDFLRFVANLISPLDNDGYPIKDFHFYSIPSYLVDKIKNALASLFYLSKHFISFVCDGDIRLFHKRLKTIIDYYIHSDYVRLVDVYSKQERNVCTIGDVSYLYQFYDNIPLCCDDSGFIYYSLNDYEVYLYDSLSNFKPYQDFVSKVNIDWINNVKHKVLNDKNEIFCLTNNI